MSSDVVVLFDAECPPCSTLAALLARRAGSGLEFRAWQEFAPEHPGLSAAERAAPADTLRLWTGHELLSGDAAWERLVAFHPDMAALDWMAAELGLRKPLARGLSKAGGLLRRLCPSCVPQGLRALARRSS